ncbi:MAG: hypothetical protein ACYTGH_18615 [Planctomycetota bacterium]|jgi:hypothetical protein
MMVRNGRGPARLLDRSLGEKFGTPKRANMDSITAAMDEILMPLEFWLPRLRDEQGRYRSVPAEGEPPCLYATCGGFGLAAALGQAPDDPVQRASIEFMLNCQSADDGYFRCPFCAGRKDENTLGCNEANRDAVTYKVASTLLMAGARPRYSLPDGDMFGPDVGAELRSLFETNNPYHAGAEVWKKTGLHGLKLLTEGSDPAEDPYVSRVMAWLLANQDEATGFWFPRGDTMNGMNGLLKMRYGTFDVCGMDIPNAETVLATLLTIPNDRDGRFGPACADWNGAGLLAELGRRHPRFRDAILEVYSRLLPAFAAKRDSLRGGLAWEPGQTDAASLNSTHINVMALLVMKAFVFEDDEGIDRLFYMRTLRRRLLGHE